jgi:hypothetical protein
MPLIKVSHGPGNFPLRSAMRSRNRFAKAVHAAAAVSASLQQSSSISSSGPEWTANRHAESEDFDDKVSRAVTKRAIGEAKAVRLG